jgi:hypothetical protein
MSPLRIALVFIAIAVVASQDAVMPEQEFVEESQFSTDQLTAFLQQNAEQAKTDPDGALSELTNMMVTAPTRDISKLEEAIEALIKEVKKDHKADEVSSQDKVNNSGQELQTCGNKPEVDETKKTEQEDAQKKLDDAEDDVKKKSTGKVAYNLGDSTTSSAAAVSSVNAEMTEIKKAFDALIGASAAARSALEFATSQLKSANKALYDQKHQCFCLKKKAFDSLFKTVNDASERNHELAHFHTVKCLMTEYKKGNMHNNAIGNCKDEYAKLMKEQPTKGLDDSSGKVTDTRFVDCSPSYSNEYGLQQANKQCHVHTDKVVHTGDRADNPVILNPANGGGFFGKVDRLHCQGLCNTEKDPHGRPCVAFEFSDSGFEQPGYCRGWGCKRHCALTWGCDYTKPWTGGSVYMRQTA